MISESQVAHTHTHTATDLGWIRGQRESVRIKQMAPEWSLTARRETDKETWL